MERVKRLNEKTWKYLNKWPKEAWTKAHFRENCKVDNDGWIRQVYQIVYQVIK